MPDLIGQAELELARIDEGGAILDTLVGETVGGGAPLDACQEVEQTLVLPAGRYRLSASATANAESTVPGLSATSCRFDVELREIAN